MLYNVIPTDKFYKDMKHYVKKKNYYKLKDDMDDLVRVLESGELVGEEIPKINLPLEKSSYKVRMANNTTKVGKSNGFRLIYYVIKNDKEIYLLTIYEKAEKDDIKPSEIIQLIKKYV